jgi:diguanylate cyclase (GGDEF)-like protein/putative nucleotidyltransferase with HDIG domain
MPKVLSIGEALPPRLRWYVLAVIAAGMPVVAAAAAPAVQSRPSPSFMLGVCMFFVFTLLAEWRPVPIDPSGTKLVSLAFVFIIASRVIFGWEWSVLIGAGAIGLAMAAARTEPLKVAFNVAAYAIAAALSSVALVFASPTHYGYGSLAFCIVLSGGIFVLVNVLMVCVAMGLAGETRVFPIFMEHLRQSGPIFGIMVFVAAQAVIFWQVSPPLVLLLGAPLVALTLYQRSAVRHRVAEEAASTDSLTGLKNRRAFEEDAGRMLAASAHSGDTLALCLIDVDRFKLVNDRHGHLAGDAILESLAAAIEATVPGRGYRLGGDEYGLLIQGSVTDAETAVAELQRRFADTHDQVSVREPVTISAGIAVHPFHADDLHSLKRRADMALYQSKFNGRDRATVFTGLPGESDGGIFLSTRFPTDDVRLMTVRRLAALVDAFSDASAEAHGTLAAHGYSSVLDHWRSFDGNHSQAVARLAVELARKLGVEGDELEHIHLAALLHDVGKIGVPEHILNKAERLTDVEQALVERHAVIGYELVQGLGLSPVDVYVLHHHERWDGTGYPHGLAGAEIPFGSRLILVADAFDALISDRSYRPGVSVEAAMHELHAESGRQFDPLVVATLHDWLTQDVHGDADSTLIPKWSSSTSRC